MKQILLVFSIAFMTAACNHKTETKSTTADTTGLAAYQAFQQKRIADSIALANQPKVVVVEKPVYIKSSNGSSSSTTMTSESANTASKKKGLSKTAKGAIIGGVVGAGTGAVVNKKNRAAGAVIGGVIGAGAGAVIGNQKDKKDGRH